MSGDFVRGLSLSAKYDLLDFLPAKEADSTEGDSSQGNGRESGHTSSASSSIGSRSSESLAPQGPTQLQIQELFGGKKKRDSKELTSRSGRSSNAKSNKCRRSKVESALTNAIKNAGDGGRVNSPSMIAEGPWASSHSEWGEYVDVEDNAGTSHEGTPSRTVESQIALNAQLYESSTRESQSKAAVDKEIARISAAATSKWNSVALKKRDRYAVASNAQDEILDTTQTILSSAVYDTRAKDGSKTVPLETSPHRTKPTGSTRQGSPCVRVERMVNDTGLDELSSKAHGEDYRYSATSSSRSRTGHSRGVAPRVAQVTRTSGATATPKNGMSQGGRLFGKNLGDSKKPPKIVEGKTHLEGKTHSVVKPVPFHAPTVSVHPSHGTVAEAGLSLSTHSDPGTAQSPRRSFYAEDGMIFDLELDDGTSHSK